LEAKSYIGLTDRGSWWRKKKGGGQVKGESWTKKRNWMPKRTVEEKNLRGTSKGRGAFQESSGEVIPPLQEGGEKMIVFRGTEPGRKNRSNNTIDWEMGQSGRGKKRLPSEFLLLKRGKEGGRTLGSGDGPLGVNGRRDAVEI